MAKQGLHCSDISAFFDQACRETMSEGMWRHFLVYACKSCISSYNLFYSVSAETLSFAVSGYAGKQIFSIVISEIQIFFQ
jgi:hypothetical protein